MRKARTYVPFDVLAALGGAAGGQEVLSPPAGTQFVMRCSAGQTSTRVFAENANGTVKVH
ncbi:MAG: hypothetical protein O3A06_07185 [Proteobacteria bacterium]|nr:hypothetical protein [Pseudomonadota bacterium]MDA0982801.1 hypothetical protein [Pseudomonadota bacterium]